MENKNNQIETLRAAAIVFVLLNHFPASNAWFTEASSYVELWSGVDLFFAISGYLITRTLDSLYAFRNDRKKWLPELKAFWIRRIFRLLPAAWLWLTIPLILSITLSDHQLFPPFKTMLNDVAAAALQIANIYWAKCISSGQLGQLCSLPPILSPYWSLSLEEQFYFLLPLIIIAIPRRLMIPGVAVLIITLSLWERSIFTMAWFMRPDSLLWGVLIALLSTPTSQRKILKKFKLIPIHGLSSIALLLLLTWIPSNSTLQNFGIPTVPLVSIVSALLVFLASRNKGLTPGKFLLWVSSRSYSIYLTHMSIYALLQILLFPVVNCSLPELTVYAACAFTLISFTAEITYRAVELPLRKYGRNIAANICENHKQNQGNTK